MKQGSVFRDITEVQCGFGVLVMHTKHKHQGQRWAGNTEVQESPQGLGSRMWVWICCHGEMEKDLGKDLGSYSPAVPKPISEEMSSDSVLLPLTWPHFHLATLPITVCLPWGRGRGRGVTPQWQMQTFLSRKEKIPHCKIARLSAAHYCV